MASLVEFSRSTQCISTIRGKQICNDARQAKDQLIYFVMSGTVEVHGSDNTSSTLHGAGRFWGLSCVFNELQSDGVVTAHSSNVELLTVSAKILLEKVDDQTLRHMAELAGFTYERSQLRSQQSQRKVNFVDSSDTMDTDIIQGADSGASLVDSADDAPASSLTASALDVCSQVISRATSAEPRKQLAPTPSGWLPLQVDEKPRASLRRIWIAKGPAQGIAVHVDELISLLDSNEALLAQLSGESCVAVLNALSAVNKYLDVAGVWRGHSSAQEARRKLEMEAELSQLTGQSASYDTDMGRLQLEVLLKLTSARIAQLAKNAKEVEISPEGRLDRDLDLDLIHSKISECLECVHRQLLDAPAIAGDDILGESHDRPLKAGNEGDHSSSTLNSVTIERNTATSDIPTEHLGADRTANQGTVCRIGGVVVPFASGRWVWLSKSRKSVFPYGEEDNALIEEAFSNYSAQFRPMNEEHEYQEERQKTTIAEHRDVRDHRTVVLPDQAHFIDFEQMREIRCDSHELFKEVKRLRAGIDRFEPWMCD